MQQPENGFAAPVFSKNGTDCSQGQRAGGATAVMPAAAFNTTPPAPIVTIPLQGGGGEVDHPVLSELGFPLPPVAHERNLLAVDTHIPYEVAAQPAHHGGLARDPGVEGQGARGLARVQ